MMPRRRSALLLILSLLSSPLMAADYQVDLLIYADRDAAQGTAGELPSEPAMPDLARALEVTDDPGLRAVGITMLPTENFALQKQWDHLLNSRRFEPIHKLSWRQRNPPTENGPAIRLAFGPSHQINDVPMYFGDLPGDREPEYIHQLDGTVTLLLSRYLHLDARLSWTEPGPYGDLGSYHLRESRRMRSGELHHLDSPRFGLLVRVTKAQDATQ